MTWGKGYAFIRYAKPEEADKAIQEMNGMQVEIRDRWLNERDVPLVVEY